MRLALEYAGIGAGISLVLGWLAFRFSPDFLPAQAVSFIFVLPLIGLSRISPGFGALAGHNEHSLQFTVFMCIYFLVIGSVIGGVFSAFQRRMK
jgi:hypothetical protein